MGHACLAASAQRPRPSSASFAHKSQLAPSSLASSRVSSGFATSADDASSTRSHSLASAQGRVMSVAMAPVAVPVRERVLSCPDGQHHSQSEMAKRLASLFVVEPALPAPTTRSTSASKVKAAEAKLKAKFEAHAPHQFDVDFFIQRLVHYISNVASEDIKTRYDVDAHSDIAVRILIASRILIDRVTYYKGMRLTATNAHRLIMAAVICAWKSLDDSTPGMRFFSAISEFPTEELVDLEIALVELLEFSIAVDKDDFVTRYETMLECSRRWSEGALDARISKRRLEDFI